MPLLLRRSDAAVRLAVSESQILKWERKGLLHPINLKELDGGIRSVRYDAAEVDALAQRWINAAKHQEACA